MSPLHLGEWLADLRRANGWNLEELKARTKINPRFLDALERGDLDSLPSLAHARAFALSFARACGAKEEEALEKVQPAIDFLQTKSALPPKTEAALPAPSQALQTSRQLSAARKRRLRAIAASLVIAASMGFWGFWFLKRAFRPPAAVSTASSVPAVVSSAPAQMASPQGEELCLRSRRPCWVVLQVDGQRLPVVILEPHKKERWQVRQKAVMLASNIGAVRVWWRGENLGYFGALGKRMNGVVFEPGQPWRLDSSQDLPLPSGVPASPPLQP